MKASMLLAAMASTFFAYGGSNRTTKRVKTNRGKATPALTNLRTAERSKRVMRMEQGMRPREAVHARKIARRARHAVKGTPCNS